MERRKGAGGYHVGRDRRHPLGPHGVHDGRRLANPRRFAQKRGLALVAFDEMDLRGAENRKHERQIVEHVVVVEADRTEQHRPRHVL